MKRAAIAILQILIIPAVLAVSAYAAGSGDELAYYLEENSARYETYQAENPDIPYEQAVAYVNAGVDKGFYGDIHTISEPGSISVMVNKNHALSSDYVPDDLVAVDGCWQLRSEAAEHFIDMREAAAAEGLTLVIRSTNRSYSTQGSTYYSYVNNYGVESADSQSARPGHSEHQLGLAIDMLQRSGDSRLGHANFEYTREYAWLTKHAHEYGYILRYPKGYTSIHGYIYEPWHWRYVGVETATAMYDEGIVTLEEYYGKYLAPAVLEKLERGNIVEPSQTDLNVDGTIYSLSSYTIDGNNYYRLRDIAYALRYTGKQFDLGYDGSEKTVIITRGVTYTSEGGEELGDAHAIEQPELRNLPVSVDGAPDAISSFVADGSNYVKLRDLGRLLGFIVDWDAESRTNIINTGSAR